MTHELVRRGNGMYAKELKPIDPWENISLWVPDNPLARLQWWTWMFDNVAGTEPVKYENQAVGPRRSVKWHLLQIS